MHTRNFSFDKFKNKVSGGGRRSSEPSILEIASSKITDRRNSISHPMIIISESFEDKKSSHSNSNAFPPNTNNRLRSHSLSIANHHVKSNSRSRSRSVSKKQTKELIRQETAQVILKKLLHVLQDLGLQQPIPLKTTNGNLNGPISKTSKIYVANTNDCIYLAPASSASFTYEDVENGGIPQDHANELDDEDDDEYPGDIDHPSLLPNDDDSSSVLNGLRQSNEDAILSDDEDAIPLSPPSNSRFNSRNNSRNDSRPDLRANPNLNSRLTTRRLQKKMESFYSPNYLCTKIDSETPIPHTFALIIELDKETNCKDVKFEFQSLTNILWPSGDPYNKSFVKEKFKIGQMEWLTSLNDADFYINSSNSNDIKTKNISTVDLAKRTREYKLTNIRELAEGSTDIHHSNLNIHSSPSKHSVQLEREKDFSKNSTLSHSSNISTNYTSSTSTIEKIYKPGLYVFLLPILLPEHIPPTINSVNGSLIHNLSVTFNKISEKLNRKLKVCASYNLPMVRTPPSFANSIADKPIYVNRVWNDSLHYIITFPKKYISLGSEHLINVKLVPLVKDVIIKRIKFNVLERITYVSKNLSREYDYDGEDPYYLKSIGSDSKTRERVVPVCELKTKNKSTNSNQAEPYKEEVIKCPDNNLLNSCYEPEDNDLEHFALDDPLSKPKDSDKTTMIASPLDINIALPFLTTRSDKAILTSSISNQNHEDDDQVTGTIINSNSNPLSNSSSRKASISARGNVSSELMSPTFTPSSPHIGSLETNLSHSIPDFLKQPSSVSGSNIGTSRKLSVDDEEILKPDSTSFMPEESHNHLKEHIQQGYTTVSKALSPDSNFRHIQIHHRLQVCFRISKPDPNDDYKMHHYEVVVDTPLILLSAKCNDESIQLPKYDEIDLPINETSNNNNDNGISFRTPNFEHNGVSIKPLDEFGDDQLPSFQEAISATASPITRSVSLGDEGISRLPSVMPKDPAPAYEVSLSPTSSSHTTPLNIDELVNYNDLSQQDTSTRQSRIRSSLAGSFAPSNITVPTTNDGAQYPVVDVNQILSNEDPEDLTGRELDIESGAANDDLIDNVSTTPTSSSNGATSSTSTDQSIESSNLNESALYLNNSKVDIIPPSSSTGLTTEDERSIEDSSVRKSVLGLNATPNFDDGDSKQTSSIPILSNPRYDDNIDDADFEIDDNATPKVTHLNDATNGRNVHDNVPDTPNELYTVTSQDDEQASIFTQETQDTSFDQRLPLLENQSIDNLARSVSSMGIRPSLSNTKNSSFKKQLNDNLSIITEANQPAQDMYNAF